MSDGETKVRTDDAPAPAWAFPQGVRMLVEIDARAIVVADGDGGPR